MIVVRVELHPSSGDAIVELGELKIWNLGGGTKETADYQFSGSVEHFEDNHYAWGGRIASHKRGLHVWHLVRRALERLP